MVRSSDAASRPVWAKPSDAVFLVLRGRTVRIAVPVALVVGTVISLVNQAGVILDDQATTMTWVRIFINYLVPFIVASVAYLSACRSSHAQ